MSQRFMDNGHGSQRALQRALLAYVLLIVLLLTLSPFRFAWPDRWVISVWSDHSDAPANFLLFLPVGYFFRLAQPRIYSRAVLQALLFGTLLSATIETLQFFLPDRLTSVFDLIGNGLGAAAGAILCNALRRRLARTLPSVLSLEHPLMTLVYLLLPLMWLAGTAVDARPARVWLLAPLGIMGALTMIGLWRFRFAAAIQLPRPLLALSIGAWFVFGGVTSLQAAPQTVAQCTLGLLALSLILMLCRGPHTGPERRFATRILIGLWPWYVIYLAMLVLWPMTPSFAPFDMALAYPEYGFDRGFAIRIAEQLGALTVFGFLVTESINRRRLAPRRLIVISTGIGAACALIMEIQHGFLAGDRASVGRFLLGCAAATFGAYLARLQLDFVRLHRTRSQ